MKQGWVMTSFKYIAAVLALVGAVGSAQAASEVNKEQIQFMGDQELNEVVGAKFDGFSLKEAYTGVTRALSSGSRPNVTKSEADALRKKLSNLFYHKTVYSKTYVEGVIKNDLNKADKN
jgi:hypothetical protein